MKVEVVLSDRVIRMLERFKKDRIDKLSAIAISCDNSDEMDYWLEEVERYEAMDHGRLLESFLLVVSRGEQNG